MSIYIFYCIYRYIAGTITNSQETSTSEVTFSQQLDRNWDEASQQLSVILEGGGEFFTDVVPFDAASEVPIDDQR